MFRSINSQEYKSFEIDAVTNQAIWVWLDIPKFRYSEFRIPGGSLIRR